MDYEDPSSLNLYAYAKANPLKYLDYDGHECIEEKSYLEKSLEMIILGDYSDEVTGLGLLGSVALGVLGLDLPADIRDLTACFTVNFDPSDPMWWLNLDGCAAAFLPLVGGLKFLDEGAELLKYSDEAAEALKHTDEAGKSAKHLDEVVETSSDVHPELDELEKFYDEIYEQQRTPCLEYEEYLDELKKLQDEPDIVVESGTPSVDIELKYKDGWTAAQKAEADAKVKALSNATTVKTPVNRGGTSAASRYKSAYGKASVPSGYDVDHTIDLQLGGADDILNMNPLDMSVNRSLGVQIKNAIKDYPDGTVFGQFTIQ